MSTPTPDPRSARSRFAPINRSERNHAITRNDIKHLNGADVYEMDGDKVGSAGQVYLDNQTGEPERVSVRTGLFGAKESFVPSTRPPSPATGADPVRQGPGQGAPQRATGRPVAASSPAAAARSSRTRHRPAQTVHPRQT
jgi:PRC-barrel domain